MGHYADMRIMCVIVYGLAWLSKYVNNDMVVTFDGVIGANMSRFNNSLFIDPEQDCYDESILELNRVIRQTNIAAQSPHAYFTGKVHKWRNGKCYHQYFHLYDGIHLNSTILNHWATLIIGLRHQVLG